MNTSRMKKVCGRCSKEFSTHSTNRDQCYKCKPKCTEHHDFRDLQRRRELEAKKAAQEKA
jgi:hypothetical protein